MITGFHRVFLCGWIGGLVSRDFELTDWYGLPAAMVICVASLFIAEWAARRSRSGIERSPE